MNPENITAQELNPLNPEMGTSREEALTDIRRQDELIFPSKPVAFIHAELICEELRFARGRIPTATFSINGEAALALPVMAETPEISPGMTYHIFLVKNHVDFHKFLETLRATGGLPSAPPTAEASPDTRTFDPNPTASDTGLAEEPVKFIPTLKA